MGRDGKTYTTTNIGKRRQPALTPSYREPTEKASPEAIAERRERIQEKAIERSKRSKERVQRQIEEGRSMTDVSRHRAELESSYALHKIEEREVRRGNQT